MSDELEDEMFESALPVQHSHAAYENDDIGLYVGLWDTTSMTEVAAPYTCDEFMWLLEGEVDIRNNQTGALETVRAGEAFVIPRGYDCQWQQNGYLRKFYVIYEPPENGIPREPAMQGIVKLCLNGGADATSGLVSYRGSDGKFQAGSWRSDAFKSELCSKPYHQFVFIAVGDLCVTDESGKEHSFHAGEALFLPQGTASGWCSRSSVGLLLVKVYP